MVRHQRYKGQARENVMREKPMKRSARRQSAPRGTAPPSGDRPTEIEHLTLSSVPAGRAAVRSFHISLQAPAVDHFGVETPVGADSETRQFAPTQQFVNRRRMYAKIFRQFLNRHHAR